MARPKRGTKGSDIASAKWRETMLKKYGGEEGFHKKMQAIGSIGGSKDTIKPKGFAANPELARRVGKIGGHISRRGPAKKDDIDQAEEILEQESGRD